MQHLLAQWREARGSANGDPMSKLYTGKGRLGDNDFAKKFYDRVDVKKDHEDWAWKGAKSSRGYGRVRIPQEHLRKGMPEVQWAHKVSYHLAYGPIPKGHVVDHAEGWGCKSHSCVNPQHLQAVTTAENTYRHFHPEHVHDYNNASNGGDDDSEDLDRTGNLRRKKVEAASTGVEVLCPHRDKSGMAWYHTTYRGTKL